MNEIIHFLTMVQCLAYKKSYKVYKLNLVAKYKMSKFVVITGVNVQYIYIYINLVIQHSVA